MFDLASIAANDPDSVFFTATDILPDIPTMTITRLKLDLLLRESPIDLAAVSEVVLADVGATLQILRLVGEEFASEEERPTRMEDCIASLSLDYCYQVVGASSVPQSQTLQAEWQRLRRVAECARNLAEYTHGVSPAEAYLVGLLAEVGRLPEMLGWAKPTRTESEQVKVGIMLAEHWNLPSYLARAIREQHEESLTCPWSGFLKLARRMAQTLPVADSASIHLSLMKGSESGLEVMKSNVASDSESFSPLS